MVVNVLLWCCVVCGDLIVVFDFVMVDVGWLMLFDMSGYVLFDCVCYFDYILVLLVLQKLLKQEVGLCLVCVLLYELFVYGCVEVVNGQFWLIFVNMGCVGVVFQVQLCNCVDGLWVYMVEVGKCVVDIWSVVVLFGLYDFDVYGLNGFYCYFCGLFVIGVGSVNVNFEVIYGYDVVNGNIMLCLMNCGYKVVWFKVMNVYGYGYVCMFDFVLGVYVDDYWDLCGSYGWYDLIVSDGWLFGFLCCFVGYVEIGCLSISDLLICMIVLYDDVEVVLDVLFD